MLGVPTSPLVSNGSLVGLTLITLLLISVSVYAIQPVSQPASIRASWPKVTRRHTVSIDSEYGMIDSRRIGYVIWKGRKLTAARVASLQRQLDLVMAGQLSLDVVKQPSHDILLTIIEKNSAFDAGMKALSEGMARIDYSNTRVDGKSALPDTTIRLGTIDSVKVNSRWIKIVAQYARPQDNSSASGDTSRLRAVKQQLELLTKQMKEVMAERQPMADRLTREMAELAAENGDYQKQLDPYRNQIGQLAKQQRALAAQMLALQREAKTLSRQNSAKAKALLQQKEAQADQLEKQMDELDAQLEKLDAKLEPLNARLGPYQQRMEMLADSIEKLYEPTNALSEQMGALSEQFAEQAEKQADEAMRQAEEALKRMDAEYRVVDGDVIHTRPARAPRAARSPRPASAPKAPRSAVKVSPPSPATAPNPAAVPAITPKPAVAPKVRQ